MRKVLFLMFLLLLMGLGAASVKAQVRIGGNTPPNPAAALDLNADDSATPAGNKGALAFKSFFNFNTVSRAITKPSNSGKWADTPSFAVHTITFKFFINNFFYKTFAPKYIIQIPKVNFR